MRKTRSYSICKLIVISIFPIFLYAQKNSSNVILEMNHFVGDKPLVLEDSIYYNALGQSYFISKFNYYISQINFIKKDGSSFLVDQSYLISEEEEKQKSKQISVNLPEGEYASIHFILGVDSARNCSGAQTGALDPINAMFWTWNTGYIFLKLEGKSKFSSAPGLILEYHIGGYKKGENSIRTIILPFKEMLILDKNQSKMIPIKVDISEIFKTPTTIDFSKNPVVNLPIQAKIVADNYSDIFQLIEVVNEK